jgi:hypothetical protein
MATAALITCLDQLPHRDTPCEIRVFYAEYDPCEWLFAPVRYHLVGTLTPVNGEDWRLNGYLQYNMSVQQALTDPSGAKELPGAVRLEFRPHNGPKLPVVHSIPGSWRLSSEQGVYRIELFSGITTLCQEMLQAPRWRWPIGCVLLDSADEQAAAAPTPESEKTINNLRRLVRKQNRIIAQLKLNKKKNP